MTPLHACLLATILAIGQAEIESQAAATRREIAMAIRDLGSSEFEVRQAATQLLWKAGEAAKPALQRALESPHSEVRFRAQSILEDFEYGVFADTPRDVAAARACGAGSTRATCTAQSSRSHTTRAPRTQSTSS